MKSYIYKKDISLIEMVTFSQVNRLVRFFIIIMLFSMPLSPFFFNIQGVIRGDPISSEGVYGTDFNGIYRFDNYSIGSDPWYETGVIGPAEILHTFNGHSYVYDMNNAGRGIYVTNDMTSDWKIDVYVSLSNINVLEGACMLILRSKGTNRIYYGWDGTGAWMRSVPDHGAAVLLEGANWSSNSWMNWRVEYTASSHTYRFLINNSLLDTYQSTLIDVLGFIAFHSGAWGNAGHFRIDSLSYSWHPEYYEGMIFDEYNEDTDGDSMPNNWETENGLDPDDDTDALIDSDMDGLLNLYEYGNQTDPQDADSDNDLLNDGPEVKIYLTDPNDADSDNDALTDGAEINTHLTDPNDIDSDNDLLSDGLEVNTYGTDPNDADSDDDGYSDKQELDAGKDPNNVNSYPGMIEPERIAVFLTFIVLAVVVSVFGAFIVKKQHKRRFMI